MNPQDEEGIDREAWRRGLGDAGEPAPFTDARIRAAARRALTPRIGRWWLPASLAASLMLAVFLVQWQFEEELKAPIIGESDVMEADAPMEMDYVVAPEAPAEAPVSAPMMELPAVEDESRLRRVEPSVRKREATPAADDAGGSLWNYAQEPAAPAAVAPAPTPSTPAAAVPAPAPAASGREDAAERSIAVTGARLSKEAALAAPRAPEQWYADIEALRAAGKDAEADAELEKLEAAYPGWLESRQPEHP